MNISSVLVVDDQEDIVLLIKEILEEEISGVIVYTAYTIAEARKVILENKIDIMLLDIWLEKQNDGIEFLLEMKKANYNFLIIMISGHGNIQIAVNSIRNGAYDYIEKPFPSDKLINTIKNSLNFISLKRKNFNNNFFFSEFLEIAGESKFANEMRDFVKKFAKSQSRILIYGEPGSGKEFFARLIHHNSFNLNQEFYSINHSDIIVFNNINLSETFTSGTIFIDEIEKFPLYFQKSILDFINHIQFNLNNQNSSINSIQTLPRVIISSSLNIKKLEEISLSGHFNMDLFNRINVLSIEMQSLSKRSSDFQAVSNIFFNFFHKICNFKMKKFSQTAVNKLLSYDWPGNFSELKNLIEWILINSDKKNEDDFVELDLISSFLFSNYNNPNYLIMTNEVLDTRLREAKDLFEKRYIMMQLKKMNGSITKTADFIGMDRSALHRKLKILKIDFV